VPKIKGGRIDDNGCFGFPRGWVAVELEVVIVECEF
jgi:hypothetical protein